MGGVPAWIEAIAAAVGLCLTIVTGFELRLRAVSRSAHARIDREVLTLGESIEGEATERKRDVERIDDELKGIDAVQQQVSRLESTVSQSFERLAGETRVIGESVRGFAERFGDFKTTSEKASDNLTATVRAIDQQVTAIAIEQARTGHH